MSLAGFKILKFIGKGSYGSVYKVLRKSDDKEYALKEVNIKPMSQKEREEAVNEIRLLASINSPFVIGYYEAFCEGDKIYIVTEYAENGDLSRKVKKYKSKGQTFDESLVWSIFWQLCTGLRALHQLNILHRDMKSQNIFLMSDDTIKIGDLGVAKLLKEGNAQTQVGTPYYMSPEIWKNKPYDKKSDIWSLGCLLYEMATFRHPFEATSWKGLAQKVLKGTYMDVGPGYSNDIKDMIKLLLVTEPSKRPSIGEIMQMPCMVQRQHLLPKIDLPDYHAVNAPNPNLHPSGQHDLLDTIKVPRDLQKLKQRLPAANYPEVAKSGTPLSAVSESKNAPLPPLSEKPPPPSSHRSSASALPMSRMSAIPPVSAPAIPSHQFEGYSKENGRKAPSSVPLQQHTPIYSILQSRYNQTPSNPQSSPHYQQQSRWGVQPAHHPPPSSRYHDPVPHHVDPWQRPPRYVEPLPGGRRPWKAC
mmetsp:Transcript_16830/g.27674  ORF Transcript_16830/g.27674 Transcript_16830/m.27674 type:complete len:473 (-) Transcript_16830:374-1792(-)|eukprot:CAMPEP_0184336640 /NCGR_PEP_ID=MMETSP1089-20130417/4853_1 /TAXON_ID=38269 ORGANISM="Gloeochaete wittrockiana, Strain SAG46.84" /NCGR_SAMPLE_ID=MMETSP1089 /ASSEMBLY_ACC=CAM_ASM_000445 /LENGTH=472 /DNA_ID=CAMNT_0026661693 /DNA_START=359 /DNA_END=1780 /DNA_ORIENTATION=+